MKSAGITLSETKLRDGIVAVGRSLFERGLSPGSSGNISVRLEDGFLLTPTNASLGRLDPGRLSKVDFAGRLLSGDPPTKEDVLHRAFYDGRGRAGAIVHLHATHSAAVSCMKDLDPDNCMPPLTPYHVMKIGRLPLLPYHRPGDPALADVISARACRHCAVLLANHGPLVSGPSLEEATNAVEELEETAKLFLLLRGSSVRPLDEREVQTLADVFGLDEAT